MQEPTSGLDSSTAFSLMELLKQFTKQSGKAVVVSIHQPSSQIFHMFTHLLLLADGRVGAQLWAVHGLKYPLKLIKGIHLLR